MSATPTNLYLMPPPECVSIRTDADGRKFYHRGTWVPVPLDQHGVPAIEWLRWLGARIVASDIREERHRVLGGTEFYQQKYRVDTYEKGARVPFYAASNETRGLAGVESVWWPLPAD